MGFFTKAGKGIDSLFSRKKAIQGTDPSNELFRQLFSQLGFNLELLPYDIKSYIEKGYLINPHVYTVINRIIRPASSVPHSLYELVEDKKKEYGRYQAALKAGLLEEADYYQSKSMKPVTSVKEITQLLEQPNENQSFQEWSEQGMGFYLLTGEEFIYGLAPAGFTTFTKLYNMPSQLTVVELGNWQNPIKGYRIEQYGLGVTELLPPEQILHIKYFNPEYDGKGSEIRGLSPISPLCKVVKKSNDNMESQMRILQNGHPVGILSSSADRGLNTEEAKKLRQDFDRTYGGSPNKGKVHITSAQIAWQQLGFNSVDMQLLDADKLDLETISRVYQVPLPIVLNDASSYNNMKEAAKMLYTSAIIPLLDKRKSSLNRWLLPGYKKKTGKNLYIDYDLGAIDALKRDDKEVAETIAIEIGTGIMTPNEGRELRRREPKPQPGADELYFGKLKPLKDGTGTEK